MSPEGRETLRGVAVAGNTVALFVLVLVCLNATALFHPGLSRSAAAVIRPGAAPTSLDPAPRRLLFILLDGMRTDTAEDAVLMPELHRLAQHGSRTVAEVEALIPSTVAGLRAEVEGIVAPPAGFVFDFASGAAASGGFLELNRQQGGRSFVAAPSLWTDLYGAWIDEAMTTGSLDVEDQQLLEAGLARAGDPRWRVVVVHLSRPDVAAHLAGGASARYRAAAAWCNQAVGQLVRVAGLETTVVVASDHGVSDRGGHAGPEPHVLRIPVVAAGPGAARLPAATRQVEVAAYLESTLLSPAAPIARSPVPPKVPHLSSRRGWWWSIPLALVALGAALRLLATLIPPGSFPVLRTFNEETVTEATDPSPSAGITAPRQRSADFARRAFCLHLGLWVVGGTALFSPPWAAGLGTAILLGVELLRSKRHAGESTTRVGKGRLWQQGWAGRLNRNRVPAEEAERCSGESLLDVEPTTHSPQRERRRQHFELKALGSYAGSSGLLLLLCLLGLGVGIGRLKVAAIMLTEATEILLPPPWTSYLFTLGAALLLGYSGTRVLLFLSRRDPPWLPLLSALWGTIIIILAHRVLQLPGETVSLSTLDVRAAFTLGSTWVGFPGTVLLAALQPYAALLCLVGGSFPLLCRTQPCQVLPWAAGASAILLGEAVAAAATFAARHASGQLELTSLALGLLVRLVGEMALLFPLLALLTYIGPWVKPTSERQVTN